ncbi:hypothetical protein [Caballeronia grimmiae]|uniref:hypothetical protein n=1 Tax=Caballeronia grimmiae TaxID=1071679 RepID=UPI0038BB9064
MNADGSGPTSYERSALVTTWRAILTQAGEIYTQSRHRPLIEHPDHIYAARITHVVAPSLDKR